MSLPVISVPVLWNSSNQFLNGELYQIAANSVIAGIVKKPTTNQVRPTYPQNTMTVDTIEVETKNIGTIYVNLTLTEYRALVSAASVPVGNNEIVLSGVIGDPWPTGDEIQSDDLIGATLTLVVVNGISIHLEEQLMFDSLTGTILFVSVTLTDDDLFQINYFK
jgi:hypothetical protein